jgi:dCTP deaminase
MSILSDCWIGEQSIDHRRIEPFSEQQVAVGVISYGFSFRRYDARVSDEFNFFTNVINSSTVDPKAFDARSFISVQAESVTIPPNSFALARSIEYF